MEHWQNLEISDLEDEIWRPLKNFEGCYEISNLGRVKSLDRLVNSGYGSFRTSKGKILVQKIDRYGYLTLALYKNQYGKWFNVHRLVASEFLNNIENKPQVNHINGIKIDNMVENLEWCTNKENMQHSLLNGLRDKAVKKGEESNFSKLKLEDVLFIRANYNKKKLNQKALSKIYNISISNISLILSRKIWSHI